MNCQTVATDAWPLIKAFRDAGEVSFQDVGLAQSRTNYRTGCALNGLPLVPVSEVKDMWVGTGEDGPVHTRLYRPVVPRDGAPGILFVHGGGWVLGDLDTHDGLCRALANRVGATVLAVDYRLAPEHPYPAAINDCRTAAKWLLTHAHEIDVDPARIAIIGDSAGGQIAAVIANESVTGALGGRLAAQVLLYPVTDLAMNTASYRRVTTGFPLTARSMKWFADLYAPDGVNRSAPDLSPLRAPIPDAGCPAMIVTVGHDPLADEGIAYAAALAHAGTRVEHLHLPGYAHGLFTSAGRIPTGSAVLDRVAAFVAASVC